MNRSKCSTPLTCILIIKKKSVYSLIFITNFDYNRITKIKSKIIIINNFCSLNINRHETSYMFGIQLNDAAQCKMAKNLVKIFQFTQKKVPKVHEMCVFFGTRSEHFGTYHPIAHFTWIANVFFFVISIHSLILIRFLLKYFNG